MPDSARSRIRSAFEELERAGVAYSFRKDSRADIEPPPGGEVDISMGVQDRDAADAALARAGFRSFEAPGRQGHRFYFACSDGRWLKIDAKLLGSRRPRSGGPGRWIAEKRPVSLRRRGPVVAVVGPDGAGKGTLITRLASELPVGVKVLYLGWRRPDGPSKPRVDPGDRSPGALLESAFVLKGWLRAGLILLSGYVAAWRGAVVLCDRHPTEALAVRPRRNRAAARLEQLLYSRLTPWPDAIVVLDAPTEVLLERKREHPGEVLDRWREGYAKVFGGRGGVLVSTAGPREEAAARAAEVVWEVFRDRRWPR